MSTSVSSRRAGSTQVFGKPVDYRVRRHVRSDGGLVCVLPPVVVAAVEPPRGGRPIPGPLIDRFYLLDRPPSAVSLQNPLRHPVAGSGRLGNHLDIQHQRVARPLQRLAQFGNDSPGLSRPRCNHRCTVQSSTPTAAAAS
jgi:hypothetical protein